MQQALDIISSFPTSIYTVILGVLLVFWIFAILGAVDFDIFSPDADVDIDLDLDVDAEMPGFLGLLHTLGLTGVPVTIVFSLLIFIAWILTYLASVYILPWVPTALLFWLAGSAVLVVSFAVAIPITARAIRPLKPVFRTHNASSNQDYVGYACKVTSLEVKEDFGQGFIEDGGAGLNVRIRAQTPNAFTKGDIVKIVSYDADNNTYQVVNEQEFESYFK